ncbi:MAG TPA: VOC family protein [Aquihabitans sp.]|nr:VOC family protein [Aquihabitans sp.]
MEFRGIDHVVYRVQDPERTVAWWRDVFGVEPERLEEWRRGEVLFVSVRLTPDTILDLFAGPPAADSPADGAADAASAQQQVDHVAFVVDGVDLDELAASGAFEVESGPHDLWGARGQGRGVYLLDPDGNRLELRTYA